VKVTLIRAPNEIIEKLNTLEEQIKNTKTETAAEKEIKVKIEESPREEFEVPSMYLDIPDSRFENMEDVDERWWWSVTELEFFPSMSFSSMSLVFTSYCYLFIESHEGLPFLEKFQVEYLRKEFDARMMNLANSIIAHRCLKLENKLMMHIAAMQEASTPEGNLEAGDNTLDAQQVRTNISRIES